jgi:hypothetical protein
MKRKPSRRTEHNRYKRKFVHEAKYSNIITLGDIASEDDLYFQDGSYSVSASFKFTDGSYITVKDMNLDNWGTRVHYGKHPKQVHPARRNKEKKKTRVEAVISAGGQSAKIVKVDNSTWIIEGTGIV